LNTSEATGDTVAKMLNEIEDTGNIKNPYSMPRIEVEKSMANLK
jgi:hypothetical protein